jgi:hypothetical protein
MRYPCCVAGKGSTSSPYSFPNSHSQIRRYGPLTFTSAARLTIYINFPDSLVYHYKMPFSYHNSNSSVPPRMVDGVGFGKTAIITGCASGIGLATLQLFLSHQYQVFGVDISEVDYTKVAEKDHERLHFHQADLLKDGECDEVVRIFVAQFGYVVHGSF